jgi:hypothetical protein
MVIALCAALAAPALGATPDAAQSQPAAAPAGSVAAEPTIAVGEAIAPEPLPMSSGITCTFNCNDGFGFFYQCPHPTLGQCCAQAQPACSSHGGLDDGICWQGRLGLPCNPE